MSISTDLKGEEALKKRLIKADKLLEERLSWDKFWLGDYPEKYLGLAGTDSLEHWQMKVRRYLGKK